MLEHLGLRYDPKALDKIRHGLSHPSKCDHCGSAEISLQRNRVVYGKDYGQWPVIWYCHDCSAMVGCHPGTDMPLGYMADRPTRQARARVHEAFDPLWKNGDRTRNEAYKELASGLGMTAMDCHISRFDYAMCERAIAFLRERFPWQF